MMIVITRKGGVGRTLARVAAGAVVGAGATMLFFELFAERHLDLDDGGTVLALVAGLVYAMMGVFVGAGVLAPGFGARFLNVENVEELCEQRPLLVESAVGSVLIGAFLLVLAAAGEGLNRDAAAVIAALCLAGILVTSMRTMSRTDELMRRISTESSALALYALVVLVGGWAALAHLGLAPWLEPLALLAIFALVELAAIFWVSGKRGLLKER